MLFLRPGLQRFALRYTHGILATARAVCQTSKVSILRTQNVLVLARDESLHPPTREADERIEAIRRTWREQTGAQSVLRSDHAARVSF